jgi:hypothetical protein
LRWRPSKYQSLFSVHLASIPYCPLIVSAG